MSSEGQTHWTKTIGGDANNYLWHIIATEDTGCLALYYRYVEIDSAFNGDFYWIKFDKFGNQDTAYLSGFNDYTSINTPQEYSEIILYPNPIGETIFFDYSSNIVNPFFTLVDVTGKIVYSNNITDKKVKIINLSKGTYFYKIMQNNKLLKIGKIQKD